MVAVVLLSIPFALLAAWIGRRWTLVLPIVLWAAFSLLESVGVLPGYTNLETVLLAGVLGACFAAAGLPAHSRLRSPAT